ncbi:MAG: hypothetical protein H6873_05635 [Hyphomicrobiaceae bacterium]|nr:hypothetical protein [Hyphomicrobiaceae bacterium]
MTAHHRKTIRDQVAAQLTSLGTTGANVFSGRVSALKESELPGLVIVPRSEDAGFDAHGSSGTFMRRVLIDVFAHVFGNDGLYDQLDQICGEVETALFSDGGTLSGLAFVIEPPTTAFDISGEGDSRVGTARMTFPVRYRTPETDPTTGA